MKIFALIGGITFGICAFRDLPPLPQTSAVAVGICGLSLLVAAYLAGRKAGGATATATATAAAKATGGKSKVTNRQGVQVVVMPAGSDVDGAARVLAAHESHTVVEQAPKPSVEAVADSQSPPARRLAPGRMGWGPHPTRAAPSRPADDVEPRRPLI